MHLTDGPYLGHWSGQPALPERRTLEHEGRQSLKREKCCSQSHVVKPLSQDNTAANLDNSTYQKYGLSAEHLRCGRGNLAPNLSIRVE